MKLALFSLLSLGICYAQEMTSIRFHFKNQNPELFYRESIRCGAHFSYGTNPYDSLGHRETFITQQRNTWIINQPSQKGRYVEDPGENFDIYAPIFYNGQAMEPQNFVEYGKEYQVFQKTSKISQQSKTIAGFTYTLIGNQVPKEMIVTQNKDTLTHIIYDTYAVKPTCDSSLFAEPSKVSFSESAAEDLTALVQQSALDTTPNYTAVGILKRINYIEPLLSSKNSLTMLGLLKGLMHNNSGLYTQVMNEKGYDFAQKLFTQALNIKTDSLLKSPISQGEQFDFFWSEYYGSRNPTNINYIASVFSKKAPFAPGLDDQYKLALQKSAFWSIASHIKQLKGFDLVVTQIKDHNQDPEVKKILQIILDKSKN